MLGEGVNSDTLTPKNLLARLVRATDAMNGQHHLKQAAERVDCGEPAPCNNYCHGHRLWLLSAVGAQPKSAIERLFNVLAQSGSTTSC